ncbi:MAG TPA: bestrophin family ion channel [Saprospiraceae bacterium]|jgi:putative membrane protein|nr:bestrophin family ion channel [Saprospiraceae bacterium]
MHIGQSYKLLEFLLWTRRNIYWLFVIGAIPTILYQVLQWKWIALPWTVVALLGTATAFIVGFKNTQTYSRTWEARQIWGSILNSSRAWGIMCRDYMDDVKASKELIYRHFAWLTALRYQMRESKAWESTHKIYNKEYMAYYSVPEKESTLELELAKYIPAEEVLQIMATKNKAVQLLGLQSKTIKELYDQGILDNFRFLEMHKLITTLYDHQGKSERIKNFPYPRQFATVSSMFVKLFCIMLPFSMLKDFDKLNENIGGIMQGQMVWLVIPFSMLISWVYTSLEQVGESTENPFEGSANDVPISQMSRTIEIDMREMLGETDLPPALQPKNNIIL